MGEAGAGMDAGNLRMHIVTQNPTVRRVSPIPFIMKEGKDVGQNRRVDLPLLKGVDRPAELASVRS